MTERMTDLGNKVLGALLDLIELLGHGCAWNVDVRVCEGRGMECRGRGWQGQSSSRLGPFASRGLHVIDQTTSQRARDLRKMVGALPSDTCLPSPCSFGHIHQRACPAKQRQCSPKAEIRPVTHVPSLC